MEAGKNVTFDDYLGSGWKHLAIVKARGRLKLYIDGAQRAVSAPFDASDYDISLANRYRSGSAHRTISPVRWRPSGSMPAR
jgi:hypothetical protein